MTSHFNNNSKWILLIILIRILWNESNVVPSIKSFLLTKKIIDISYCG